MADIALFKLSTCASQCLPGDPLRFGYEASCLHNFVISLHSVPLLHCR